MKKGFTLIELLAVIVILAIILVIAVPRILKIIDNIRLEAFIKNESMIVKAIQNYTALNINLLPTEIGNTSEIKLSDLQSNNFINVIKDPKNKNVTCNGYVLITKMEADSYEYTPHLNCENNIASSTEDGLVGHFKFDDFQEPTVNIWNQKQEWHLPTDGLTNPISYNITVTDANYYTLTSKQRIYPDDGTVNPRITIVLNYTDGTSSAFANYSIIKDGQWHTYSVTGTKTAGKTLQSVSGWVLDHSGGTANKHSDVESIQIESKKYSTEITNGVRTGTVKDFTPYNNLAELQLTTTPRWMEDSKVGSGSYEFNGIDNYISVFNNDGFNISSSVTISAWVKHKTTTGTYDCIINVNNLRFYIDTNNKLFIRFTTITGNDITLTGSITINNSGNVWTQIVVKYDGTNIKGYINGELDPNLIFSTSGGLSKMTTGYIGSYSPSVHPFNGLIDDVYLYNRALLDSEIKHNYNVENISG